LRPLGWKLQAGIPRVVYHVFKELILYKSEQYLPMGYGAKYSFGSDQLLSHFGMVHKIDVFLSLYHPLPTCRQFPSVLFIHDLIPVRFPSLFDLATHQLFQRLRHSAESCQHILTNSQASKQDIMELWGIDDQKIQVVALGVGNEFKDIVANYEKWRHKADGMLQRFGIVFPYILSVCTVEPRKNLIRLLQAYEQIRDRRKERFQLVLTGRLGWQYEDFLRQLESSKYRQDIVLTGFVADWELVALYHNATVFAYPSLYEGFGLPILEAMTCGAPVVTSMVSSMPEVGGECACYCDPYSVESMVEELETVFFDEKKQQIMSAKGIKRASQFNWSTTVATIRQVLLNAAQK